MIQSSGIQFGSVLVDHILDHCTQSRSGPVGKYHQAVKKCSRLAGSLMAKDLLEAAEKGDRDLMEELKKSMNRKCSEQAVPDSLDGNVGIDDILEQFRAVYEDLYNSAGTQEAMQEIKNILQQDITSTSFMEVEKITGRWSRRLAFS